MNPWRPRETTEASSCAQILAQDMESSAKITKLQKIQKSPNSQTLQKLQNMIYGIYTKYIMKIWKCCCCFPKFRKYFGIASLFCTIIDILNIVFGFCVFKSIWEHGLNILFWFCFEKIPKLSQKCEQFPHQGLFWVLGGMLGPKWSPYVAGTSKARTPKAPLVWWLIKKQQRHIYIYIYCLYDIIHTKTYTRSYITLQSEHISNTRKKKKIFKKNV